jgi:glycine cleavage system transcriptional repressor
MGHFAVVAIGRDRPGIVAALTGSLYEMGGNLQDVSSSILRGHFAIMLVVEAPDPMDADALRRELETAAEPLGVSVSVRDVEAAIPRRAHATHVVTAYGADRPGIVARITHLLAERRVNITDLSSRLTTEEPQVYALVAEVAVPSETDADALGRDLQVVARDLGVDVMLRGVDADTL